MEIDDPLALNEMYLRIQMEISEDLARRVSESQIRLKALNEVWAQAAEYGYQVTRGPIILDVHLPDYPGDAAFVVAIGVGCSV